MLTHTTSPRQRTNVDVRRSTVFLLVGVTCLLALVVLAPTSTSFASPDEALLAVAWSIACGLALWWTLSLALCLAANRSQSAWLRSAVSQLAMPLARKAAQGSLAIGLVAAPACSAPDSTGPEMVLIETDVEAAGFPDLPTASTLPADPLVETPIETEPPLTPLSEPISYRFDLATGPTPELFDTNILVPASVPQNSESKATSQVAPSTASTYTVQAGDNLWSIAESTLAANNTANNTEATTTETVGAYWAEVIALNRSQLRSGNPSLIFPGEVLQLP